LPKSDVYRAARLTFIFISPKAVATKRQ